MIIDAWMQHPTRRFLDNEMFSSLRRWTGAEIPVGEIPIEASLAAMDAAGVGFGLLTAWHAPREGALIANDEVAGWVAAHPQRFAGLAAVALDRPMEAVRELRRCVNDLGMVGLRMLPWLWETPPTDRRFYPLYAACVELDVPFCTQVGHTGPLRPSEPGRPIPYIDQVALDFPELVIVCGHVGYPWTEEMIAVARKHENVYIDTSAYTSKRLPPELVAYMGSRGGRRKVLFGSNYPMIFPERALADLERLGLDEEARELYLQENTRRVFSLAV
jgi:predicted TIM-barrel fold metal-dependent hydrolase